MSSVVLSVPSLQASEDLPTRANDLLYGEALFEYYQGRSFEALTVLNVAKERGGVVGHGDHPLLVEGGLMLAYGMTREAQAHFEKVLSEEMEALVSAEARNQAWFYLGKVFYLEQDYEAAFQALQKVNSEQLLEDDESLFLEWRYLGAQLSIRQADEDQSTDFDLANSPIDRELSAERQDLWSVYVLYNQTLKQHHAGESDAVVSEGFEAALALLDEITLQHGNDAEREALKDRIRLTLGQIYLQYREYDRAVLHLQKISYDSLVSDEALFQYAVAQSHLEQYALALSALNRLNERPLFTPWLQQVPYALAYLYEQLGDTVLAAQAYKAAGDHYDEMLAQLESQQSNLSEETLLAALEIPFSAGDSEASDDYLSTSRPVVLGEASAENDAYGRLQVRPADFYLANLLATEPFQLALRDLHELYKLQNSLRVWRQRLQSFELMLDTRAQQRSQKLSSVAQELDAQQADQWKQQFVVYDEAIKEALANEDLEFFMDEEQLEFAEQLHGAKQTLALLPNDEDKQEFAQKFDRIERFFNWWLADRYGVNRWAAQRQLGQLAKAMDEFESRRKYLQGELENTQFQKNLEHRVAGASTRIDALRMQIDAALEATRAQMIAGVIQEFERQKQEVAQYRLSARHAQARLTDELYRELNTPEQETGESGGDEAEAGQALQGEDTGSVTETDASDPEGAS